MTWGAADSKQGRRVVLKFKVGVGLSSFNVNGMLWLLFGRITLQTGQRAPKSAHRNTNTHKLDYGGHGRAHGGRRCAHYGGKQSIARKNDMPFPRWQISWALPMVQNCNHLKWPSGTDRQTDTDGRTDRSIA